MKDISASFVKYEKSLFIDDSVDFYFRLKDCFTLYLVCSQPTTKYCYANPFWHIEFEYSHKDEKKDEWQFKKNIHRDDMYKIYQELFYLKELLN